jgi:CheY-like chemotaxis protein
MKSVTGKISAFLLRRRGVGEDTRRLPSLVKAMRSLVPRSVMREVMSSSHDRRQWGVLAAAWVGVSEREFVSAAARELHMPYQDQVIAPDLTVLGPRARSVLTDLRKVGASVILEGVDVVGFVATDPAEVRGLALFDGTQSVSIAAWTEIAKALDKAERIIVEAEANVDRAESTKRHDLSQRVIDILISEASAHGATSFEILTYEGKTRYQFQTVEGKMALGTIQPEALEALMVHLTNLDGEVLHHATVGKVLVRALGNAANTRLSWNVRREYLTLPEAISPHVVLPASVANSDAARQVEASKSSREAPVITHPILVVDDNQMFCRVLERLLRKEQCDVAFAENGEHALGKLGESKGLLPRLIICDLHMPRMNGREFLTRVKADSRFRSIPVVILTSDEGSDIELSLLELGAEALVSKSKDPRVLCAQVARILRDSPIEEAA